MAQNIATEWHERQEIPERTEVLAPEDRGDKRSGSHGGHADKFPATEPEDQGGEDA